MPDSYQVLKLILSCFRYPNYTRSGIQVASVAAVQVILQLQILSFVFVFLVFHLLIKEGTTLIKYPSKRWWKQNSQFPIDASAYTCYQGPAEKIRAPPQPKNPGPPPPPPKVYLKSLDVHVCCACTGGLHLPTVSKLPWLYKRSREGTLFFLCIR